jgi:hypothetical protein
MGWLVAALAIFVALVAVAALLKKKGTGEAAAEVAEGEKLPYRKREWILDHGSEKDFYAVLEKACTQEMGPCRVMVQVQLSRLIEVEAGHPEWQKWRNKIDRKSVDYVVCDAGTLRPRFAVELDGTSHDSSRRKERDSFVERALEAAGVKLVRVRRGKVSEEGITAMVRDVLGGSMPVQSHKHATRVTG